MSNLNEFRDAAVLLEQVLPAVTVECDAQADDEVAAHDALVHYDQVCDVRKMLDSMARKFRAMEDRLARETLPAKMDANGTASVRVPERSAVFSLSDDNYSIKTVDKTKTMTWLRHENRPDLITETVNASALKKFIKERDAASVEGPGSRRPPEDAVEVTRFRSVVRKSIEAAAKPVPIPEDRKPATLAGRVRDALKMPR